MAEWNWDKFGDDDDDQDDEENTNQNVCKSAGKHYLTLILSCWTQRLSF